MTAEAMTQHPFFPPEIQLLNYVANDYTLPQLLGGFFSTWGVILAVSFFVAKKYNPNLGGVDTICVLWFVLTGTIHFFFEGYFAINHYRMPSQQDLFGQLWKEYSNSDSRYLTSDPFVLCMESVTALLWGPLSFLAVWLITTNSPYRYPIQAIVSLGQLYGDVLYYATNTFDLYYKGLSYSRPEPLYFWFYYVFLNSIWIVVPSVLLYSSTMATARAFRAASKAEKSANGYANGSAKKRN